MAAADLFAVAACVYLVVSKWRQDARAQRAQAQAEEAESN